MSGGDTSRMAHQILEELRGIQGSWFYASPALLVKKERKRKRKKERKREGKTSA